MDTTTALKVCVHACVVNALHLSADATLHGAVSLLLISLCEKERQKTRLTDFIVELFHHFTPFCTVQTFTAAHELDPAVLTRLLFFFFFFFNANAP